MFDCCVSFYKIVLIYKIYNYINYFKINKNSYEHSVQFMFFTQILAVIRPKEIL